MDRFLYLSTALAAMLALSAPAAQAGLGMNGPALDGRQVALPDDLWIGGAPAEEPQKITANGPALDGRRVATPDLAGLVIDHQRLPGATGGILPIDERGPGSGQTRPVQQ
jgi:hypothetical protein